MNKTILPRTFDEEKVKKNFARASVTYDWWAKATESKAADTVLKWANIQKNEEVLEVAVGTGLLFKRLVEKNKHGFTAGIDLSADMIQKARGGAQQFYHTHKYSLDQASAYNLTFDDEQFDCLISNYMLDLLPEDDFDQILKGFKRVLKPGGRMILSSMTFSWKWYQQVWEMLPAVFPEMMTQCRPIDLVPFVEAEGFELRNVKYISQNTFPSQVLLAKKPDSQGIIS